MGNDFRFGRRSQDIEFIMTERRKPLGMKNYGHIAHLPGSRMGPGDHSCELGQARIATLKARDRHDHIMCKRSLMARTLEWHDSTACSIRSCARATLPTLRLSSST